MQIVPPMIGSNMICVLIALLTICQSLLLNIQIPIGESLDPFQLPPPRQLDIDIQFASLSSIHNICSHQGL